MLNGPESVPFLEEVWRIARHAGDSILEIYRRGDLGTRHKADDSPVTEADLASQKIILDGLKALAPEIPWLSEEVANEPYAERQQWSRCWIIDPLDGTREFVARRDEFTVNIALVENGRPRLGLVYAPALARCYLGTTTGAESGAWRMDGIRHETSTTWGEARPITIQDAERDPADGDSRALRVVASRSHQSQELQRYLEQLKNYQLVSIGSSLKPCLVAEGAADFYPRLSTTMEWDIAAAHAVLAAAGGDILAFDTGQALEYNKKDLRNPHFVALGARSVPWTELRRKSGLEVALT